MTQLPMYQWIAEDLLGQIGSGVLRPGQQLPTELELRDTYDASRNTVRDAIKRLTSLGLVETRPGQGTFITRKIDPFVTVLTEDAETGFGGGEGTTYLSQVAREKRTPSVRDLKVEVQAAPAEIARHLGLVVRAQVVLRHEERLIDGVRWSLQTSYYPLVFVTEGASRLVVARDITEGTVQYLADVLGLNQTSYRDWITARTPNSREQAFFRVAHDAMVFEIFRTAYDQNKTPMRVTVTVFPIDRNQFIVNSMSQVTRLWLLWVYLANGVSGGWVSSSRRPGTGR
jgi:GntR family transcriptional regulator